MKLFSDSKPRLTEYEQFLSWLSKQKTTESDRLLTIRINPHTNDKDLKYLEWLLQSGLRLVQIWGVGIDLSNDSTYMILEKNPIDWFNDISSKEESKE